MPTILQRYVLRELLYVAFLAVLALTGMIFVGMAVSLMRAGLSAVQLRSVAPYVLAYSLPYALPCAFLVATVFVFGRLSGQNELSAIRGSGVNLNHVIFPPLLLGLVVSGGTFAVNHYLLPWSNQRVRALRKRLLNEVVLTAGSADRPYEIGRYCIYLGGLDESGRFWKDVALVELAGDFPARVMIAKRGRCEVDEERSLATMVLYDGMVLQPDLQDLNREAAVNFGRFVYTIDLEEESKVSTNRPKYLSLPDLLRRLAELKARAREIRALPQYAAVIRPKAQRRAAQREADKAYREYSRLRQEALEWAGRVQAAQEALARLEEEARTIRAAYEAALEERDDLQARLADLKPLQAETRTRTEPRARAGSDPPEDQATQEAEALAERIKALEARRSGVQRRLTELRERLDAAESRLREQRSEMVRTRSELAARRAKAHAAWERFRAKRDHQRKLEILEQLLRAERAFHSRNAGAATCLVFMLIGIPLGILSRRGSVLMAFVVSLFAVLMVYYPFMAIGQMLSEDGLVASWIAQWMPNLLVGGAGVGLVGWGIRR